MPSSTAPLVLVTGATGFIGSHTLLLAFRQGYRVRGTARSQQKIDAFLKINPELSGVAEFAIVEDIFSSPLDEAVKGADYIIHTSSPCHYTIHDNEKDMLQPTIRGTERLLRAAAAAGTVKRFCLTSSASAVADYRTWVKEKRDYTEADWNPATYEEAVVSKDPVFVYWAAKVLAERAIYSFVERERPSFDVFSTIPTVVYGPLVHQVSGNNPQNLNGSNLLLWRGVSAGEDAGIPRLPPLFIDVRDLAAAQVFGLAAPAAANQRFIVSAGVLNWQKVLNTLREALPEKRHAIPRGEPNNLEAPTMPFKLVYGKTEHVFGFKTRDAETVIVDTVRSLFALEGASDEANWGAKSDVYGGGAEFERVLESASKA